MPALAHTDFPAYTRLVRRSLDNEGDIRAVEGTRVTVHARANYPIRSAAVEPSLRVLQRMQPVSGGYLEAVPLTSFVLMSLASLGRVDHPVSRRALEFLRNSVRPDGSWPIDTDLATGSTTLAIIALTAGGEDVSEWVSLDWLLSCQHRERHPFTGADPGGWGWSDLSGAVPDADDTAGALTATCSASSAAISGATGPRRGRC